MPVAIREDGTVHHRDYREVPHSVNVGATKSGKSVFQRQLVKELAPQRVALVGIDCKQGVERPLAARLSGLATDPGEALGLLLALLVEMDDRYDLIRDFQGLPGSVAAEDVTADIWGLPDKLRPVPIVVMVDEIAELFLVASKADEDRRNRIVTALIRLAQLARAAGIYLEISGQRFGSDLGKGATMLRSQLAGRVVHRVNDLESARMGLGDISDLAMTAATRISPTMPGMAVAGDTSGRWSEIRTPERSLSEVSARNAEFAHLTPDLSRLAAFRPCVPPRRSRPGQGPAHAVSAARSRGAHQVAPLLPTVGVTGRAKSQPLHALIQKERSMSRKPSIAEIGAFLGRLKATSDNTDTGPLLAEKADLLERIAEHTGDPDAPPDRSRGSCRRQARRSVITVAAASAPPPARPARVLRLRRQRLGDETHHVGRGKKAGPPVRSRFCAPPVSGPGATPE